MSEKEVWKDVPEYEGFYQVSDMGNVRSVDRTTCKSDGARAFFKGVDITQSKGRGKYVYVELNRIGMAKKFYVHALVAMAFLEYSTWGVDSVIDHIDGDRHNNVLSNLRIISARENVADGYRRKGTQSGITGAYNDRGRWMSTIYVDGKCIRLGSFGTKEEAGNAYKTALTEVEKGEKVTTYPYVGTSSHKGVYFCNSKNRWVASITRNKKTTYIGQFRTEKEAAEARVRYEKQHGISK